MYIPKDLISDVNTLFNCDLLLSKSFDDGRIASVLDEDVIVKYLCDRDSRFIKSKKREFCDVYFYDKNEEVQYWPINVKSAEPSTINSSNKLSLLWAFTNLHYNDFFGPNSKKKITDNEWFDLMLKFRQYDNHDRDYLFLFVNKTNIRNSLLRPMRKIKNWKSNPSNDLQIDFSKEMNSNPMDDDIHTAWERIIVKGILNSWHKKSLQREEAINFYKEHTNVV